MSQHDYSKPPVAVSEYIYSNSILSFILGWAGVKKKGIRRVVLENGKEFQAYPVQGLVPDWSAILYGVTDCTGKYWAAVNDGKSCWNHLELDGPFMAQADSPYMERLPAYRKSGAPLRSDPQEWPEPYRTEYLESHK